MKLPRSNLGTGVKATGSRGAKFTQRGFNLVEVLVSLLVLSFGLLGLAALQNFSLKSTHQSFQRTQATLAIQDMIDRMRTNSLAVGAGNYNVPAFTNVAPASSDCAAAACSGIDMANYDIGRWITYMLNPKVLGPSAQGRILPVGGAAGEFQVGVSWAEGDITLIQNMTVRLQ